MKVSMMLADYVEVVGGKIYMMGGGWSVTGPGPAIHGIAVKIEVPWDQANIKHPWRLTLFDADGEPVLFETPAGTQPLEIAGEFETGRPPGLIPGSPLDVSVGFNIGPIPLESGKRFVWRLYIDDDTRDDWHLSFSTRLAALTGPPVDRPDATPPPDP